MDNTHLSIHESQFTIHQKQERMNIVVCIKQVPDTTEVKINPVTGTLIREGVPSIMNPDDKGGLEYALQLKDKFGAHVTVITMAALTPWLPVALLPAPAHHGLRPRHHRPSGHRW